MLSEFIVPNNSFMRELYGLIVESEGDSATKDEVDASDSIPCFVDRPSRGDLLDSEVAGFWLDIMEALPEFAHDFLFLLHGRGDKLFITILDGGIIM